MEQMSIVDIISDNLSIDYEIKSFLVRCYHIVGFENGELPTGFKMNLNGVSALFLHSSINYSKNPPATYINNRITMEFNESKLNTKDDDYLLLLTPWDIEAGEEEVRSEHRISVAASLFAAISGRNIICEHIFDNGIVANESMSGVRLPRWDERKPDISIKILNSISKTSDIISKLPENEKNKVELSLKWFLSAIHDDGVDAYLKYWIACETIGMPDTTNIGSLKNIIKEAYKINDNEVNDFKIGQLFGIRTAIVHDGNILPIHSQLLKYIESLYVDILFQKLNLPTERKAEKIIRDTQVKFEDCFPDLKNKKQYINII